MTQIPNVYDAEPIPATALDEVMKLLTSADLFRYTAAENAPVSLLEQEFAAMMGTKYALAVSSCSAALFLSLKALDLPRGARVLIPAFTFAAVPSSVVHADLVPLLVECGDNYRINMDDFAAKLPQADAVLISHMRGHTSDMDAIMTLCDAAGIPVIEDAAHSLGTTWNGRKIGTIGRIGCFSFQSYKMINAGEGGILVTDNADLVARAIIMSGAYEHTWMKHAVPQKAMQHWQNKLPLYNLRISNLSAAIIRPQLDELPRRVRDGLRNHDHVAEQLNRSPYLDVPAPLSGEVRAPDSIQFNLVNMTDAQTQTFAAQAADMGLKVQIFGQSSDNARAFWNWEFLGEAPKLPMTRSMLMRACDVRLPARLTLEDCDVIAQTLVTAVQDATSQKAA
ncbi:aminotransferase class I/II-fold pyridoxal phosphate-dependent enzyme [Octadecabacter sp. 1_MG-2023]|uniref:DegT/DnrJ/EryC1/StrS family aminotransferase n=1 Tax=unclassified Octadecabacter TaxID=196158 RepID=UPI001C087279|nr:MULTISPECIES: aminotransferase class I/II-fold pyridoxal phosphate-dependent enzyme [unclassified Octadecabacter]MBU2992836.1 aminotransferase class I/II-fold pyridoxal phosphate-dependent enzyme [Octadecabacter sp. B2R22]MDO6733713.1 aminotransferase class I/II-fold pyridoxal phosphate-dependent enzyme [Octadecabacter sp. 1_MG-2023]